MQNKNNLWSTDPGPRLVVFRGMRDPVSNLSWKREAQTWCKGETCGNTIGLRQVMTATSKERYMCENLRILRVLFHPTQSPCSAKRI